VTTLALLAACLPFGLGWREALVIGFGLAMSSTALVISSLAERGQLAERHGRDAFAVLLFQDLSVIPMLALLPLLASNGVHTGGNWMAALKGVAVIVAVIAGSRLVVRPLLKRARATVGARCSLRRPCCS